MGKKYIHGTVLCRSGSFLMARVTGNAGTAITQASLSTISYRVYDDDTLTSGEPTLVTGPTSLAIASVVYDTLQTGDPRWTADSTGYNFAFTLPASALPQARNYLVEVLFTPASGEVFRAIYDIEALAVHTPL